MEPTGTVSEAIFWHAEACSELAQRQCEDRFIRPRVAVQVTLPARPAERADHARGREQEAEGHRPQLEAPQEERVEAAATKLPRAGLGLAHEVRPVPRDDVVEIVEGH